MCKEIGAKCARIVEQGSKILRAGRDYFSETDCCSSSDNCNRSYCSRTINKIPQERKQISTLVSDNNDLKEKYLSIKNEMQYLLFKHESELTNANQREEILKGNLEDLNSRLGMHTAVDMHVAHLEKKFQPAETKSREQSEGLHSESRAASLGDFGRITTSELMNDRTETPTEGLAEPIYHVGTSVNANATGHFSFNWKLMLAVCLVSVVIGLIQWNKFQSF